VDDVRAELVHRPLTQALALLVRSIPGGVFVDHGTHAFARCAALPIPGTNGLIDHGGDERPVADAVTPTVDALAPDRTSPFVMTFEGRATVMAEAERLGFRADHGNAGMLLGRGAFRPAPMPPDVDVSIATDTGSLEAANRLVADAFDVPTELFGRFYTPEYLARTGGRVVLVRNGDGPVSTAIAWPAGDAVGIFNVATPTPFRGRGFGAAATSAAATVGFDAGAGSAFLQASAIGEGIYRRLGFEEVARYVVLGRADDTETRHEGDASAGAAPSPAGSAAD
jgi:ribosomal protein S18 acetylase RimI-like enzyme